MAGEQILYNRPLPGARLNMAHPLSKGLVGCWLLNENGGMRAMDLSPYGNHGTLTNFDDPPKRPFNGLDFDGVNTFIEIPNSTSLNIIGNITLEAIFYVLNDELGGIIEKNYVTGGYMLWIESLAGGLNFFVNNAVQATSPAISLNTRYHVITFADGVANQLYLNGTVTISNGSLTPSGGTSALGIGKDITGARLPSVKIELVRIYNRALTVNDIKSLSASPYNPMGLPLFI